MHSSGQPSGRKNPAAAGLHEPRGLAIVGVNAGVGISRLGSALGPSGDQHEIARIGLTILANTEHNNQFIRVQQITRPLEWLLRGQAIGPDFMRSTHRVPPQ